MNPNLRRAIAFICIFSGLFLLYLTSKAAMHLAIAAILLILSLYQIKRVG